MALTPNLSKVRVTGSFVDSQGNPCTGQVRFQLSTYLVDPVFNQIVTNPTITVTLVDGQLFDAGHVGVDLVATNDPDLYAATGVALSSVVWTVTENLTNLPSRSYPIKLDYAWQFFDLADLRDLAGNAGVGSGSQGNTGGVVDPSNPGPGTGTPGGGGGTGVAGPHAATHAAGGSDPLTPDMIGAAPASEVAARVAGDAALRSDLNLLKSYLDSLAASLSTFKSPPSAPVSVAAVAGDRRVTVSFSAPFTDGGSPITGYRVGLSNGLAVDGVSSPIIVDNLENDVPVYISVVALNGYGGSDASDVVGPVTPTVNPFATAPAAPTDVLVTAGAGQVVVSFSGPVDDGGSQVVSYRVKASTGQTVIGPKSPLTLTGLTNGVPVTVTVAALNGYGYSVESSPSSTVVPYSVPAAPTNVVATPDSMKASVSFSTPNNGGSQILDYTVLASTGQSATGNSSPITVSGLANNVAVTFTVRARNAAGASPASNASATVTPSAAASSKPSAPVGLSGSVESGSVNLTWSTPTSTGTSVLSGYRLYRVDQNGVSATPVSVASTITAYSWQNLTVGSTYTFRVAAVNDSGEGDASSVTVTVASGSGSGTELLSTQQTSIETTDLSGFSVNGTGIALSRDSSWSAAGSYSLRVASSSGVANSSGANVERVPVSPTKQYKFSATLRRGTSRVIGVVFKWRDSNNNALSNDTLANFEGLSGSVSVIEQTGTAPNGAAFLRVTIQYVDNAVTAQDYFNLDAMSVKEIVVSGGGGTTTPAQPSPFTVTSDGSEQSATVTWGYDSSAASVTGFKISLNGVESDVPTTARTYKFTSLDGGKNYTVALAGINAVGRGAAATTTFQMPYPPSQPQYPYPSDTLYPGSNLYPNNPPSTATYPGSSTYPSSSTYPGGGN